PSIAHLYIQFILFFLWFIFMHSEFRGSGRALYKLDISWPKKPEYFTGQVFGVAVNHLAGLVYVAQRGDNVPKVLVFSTDGDFLQAWNTSSLEMPHGIFLANASADPTVWITDVGNDLQVLWMHGERGQGLAQFYIPHSVAVDSYQRVCVNVLPHFCF
uniref:NHL repeat containing 3 n=1 Tax=Sinocyclocheilus grahami TaxID=75366 RepID=A0A672QZ35_SINGR